MSPLQDGGTDGGSANGDGSAEHVLDGRGTGDDNVGRAGGGHDRDGPDTSAGGRSRGRLNGDLLKGVVSTCPGPDMLGRLTVTIVQGQSVTTRWVGSVTV